MLFGDDLLADGVFANNNKNALFNVWVEQCPGESFYTIQDPSADSWVLIQNSVDTWDKIDPNETTIKRCV